MKPCRQCGWPYNVDPSGLCDNCRKLQGQPDPLTKRTTLGNVPFKDLKQLDETERFNQIVGHLRANPGKNIVVIVDTGEGYADKGDRYIRAIREQLPDVEIVQRRPGPVAGAESIILKHTPK